MRGFTKKRPTTEITFRRDGQDLTYTVTAPGLLFGSMFRQAMPFPEDGTLEEKSRYMDYRTVFFAAEGLRPTEDLPARPEAGASEEEWHAHGDELFELFEAAGFNVGMLNAVFDAFTELDRQTTDNLQEVLEEEGNG